jgi:hypothetical protein
MGSRTLTRGARRTGIQTAFVQYLPHLGSDRIGYDTRGSAVGKPDADMQVLTMGETVDLGSIRRSPEDRRGPRTNRNNAALLALRQNLEALIYQRDRANEELNTMHKRRELLLEEIDRCSRGIMEIMEALDKLDAGQ